MDVVVAALKGHPAILSGACCYVVRLDLWNVGRQVWYGFPAVVPSGSMWRLCWPAYVEMLWYPLLVSTALRWALVSTWGKFVFNMGQGHCATCTFACADLSILFEFTKPSTVNSLAAHSTYYTADVSWQAAPKQSKIGQKSWAQYRQTGAQYCLRQELHYVFKLRTEYR